MSEMKYYTRPIQVIGFLFFISLASCYPLSDAGLPVGTPSNAGVKSLEIPTIPPEDSKNGTNSADQDWVIFTKEQAEELGAASWLLESDGFWTPSGDVILELETKIAEYLRENSDLFYRQPPVWQRLEEYQRQYIGFEREDKLLIYGNFFCDSSHVNWRQELVIVMDGGECYFQLEYDADDELFINLLVNGEA